MTRQTHAPSGFPRYGVPVRQAGATVRSVNPGEEAARTGNWGAAPWPPQGRPPRQAAAPEPAVRAVPGARAARRAAATRARRERSVIGVVPYLVLLLCTIAGVYIAWRDGSNGGGAGAVIAGLALLAAAVVRGLLPARLAGLLASRRRATDVITLAAFGACMLVAGLVLPRLGPLSAQGRMAGPPMKGKYG
ncbi:MAG TPA: DUF3017 domain-containing protein [Trebonia sp.]|jgi:hypothetical protein|nr:DUF3017 domain-containing protein [Trebonia sp.]